MASRGRARRRTTRQKSDWRDFVDEDGNPCGLTQDARRWDSKDETCAALVVAKSRRGGCITRRCENAAQRSLPEQAGYETVPLCEEHWLVLQRKGGLELWEGPVGRETEVKRVQEVDKVDVVTQLRFILEQRAYGDGHMEEVVDELLRQLEEARRLQQVSTKSQGEMVASLNRQLQAAQADVKERQAASEQLRGELTAIQRDIGELREEKARIDRALETERGGSETTARQLREEKKAIEDELSTLRREQKAAQEESQRVAERGSEARRRVEQLTEEKTQFERERRVGIEQSSKLAAELEETKKRLAEITAERNRLAEEQERIRAASEGLASTRLLRPDTRRAREEQGEEEKEEEEEEEKGEEKKQEEKGEEKKGTRQEVKIPAGREGVPESESVYNQLVGVVRSAMNGESPKVQLPRASNPRLPVGKQYYPVFQTVWVPRLIEWVQSIPGLVAEPSLQGLLNQLSWYPDSPQWQTQRRVFLTTILPTLPSRYTDALRISQTRR